MQSVFVVQTNEMPLSRNPDWKTQLQFGIFRRREDAEKTMFNVMARKMRDGIDEIREMTSTKRGKGKAAYNAKVYEITEEIPRSIRVHEIRVLPVRGF
jgi:hypothetical protein|tara:strand:- start:88 stop:381 length:294 start_codon:yes stop_codon:yes gene_type:complete